MEKEVRPDLTEHSGWCLKWPVTEWNTEEHDGCPEHFATRSCTCLCGHAGSRTLESRGMSRYAVATTRKKSDKADENT